MRNWILEAICFRASQATDVKLFGVIGSVPLIISTERASLRLKCIHPLDRLRYFGEFLNWKKKYPET